MPQRNPDVYIPVEGDVINYRTNLVDFLDVTVTRTEVRGGYTNIWIEGWEPYPNRPDEPSFNINHTTGQCNTNFSQGGRWELVRKTAQIDKVRDAVMAAAEPEPAHSFSKTRYPYTYAADFLRTHPALAPVSAVSAAFPAEEGRVDWERARSGALRIADYWARELDVALEDLLVILADGYLKQWGIKKP